MSLQDQSGGDQHAERTFCHTQFQEHKTSLTWRIGNFSKSSLEVGECIESAEFGFNEELKFNLLLYPNGETELKKDFVALYINNTDDSMAIDPVTCYISIMDSAGDFIEKKKLTYSYVVYTGRREFISRNFLLNVKDFLLPDDVLTVRCDLTMVKKVEKTWKCDSNTPRIKDTDNKNTLDSDFSKLLKNGKHFSDVVFKVGRAKITAHKVILMARSPVFATMFQQDMLETKTNTVVIKDIEVQVFRQLLSYMYTNLAAIYNVRLAMDLLSAADKYDIPSLKTMCADYLSENLSKKRVFDVVACADAFSAKKLCKDCVEFISAESSSILAVDSNWRRKSLSNPQVLESILQRLPESGNFSENSKPNSSIESKTCHSRFENDVGNLTWKISGFSGCQLKNGQCLRSPEFTLRDEERKWFLKLYPNGQNEDSKGFVSLFLFFNSNDPVVSQCEFSITNTNAEKLLKSRNFELKKRDYTNGFGWSRYISAEELSDNLTNDELLIFCEVTVPKVTIHSSKEFAPTDLKINSMAHDIGRIFAKHEFADISLEINESAIPAHKIILMSRSSVFATMIKEMMTGMILKITDTKEYVFRELLRFIYTDKCSLKNVYFASEILAAAHKYNVPSLKDKCLKYLYDHISLEEVCDVVILAHSLQETQLYQDCLEYICQELPSLNFLVWPMKRLHSHPEILQDVFERYVD